MIVIPQHNKDKTLNDINDFIPFLTKRINIIEWKISVEWCTGENAELIMESQESPIALSHSQFCELYNGIYQTVDGFFEIVANEGKLQISAIDSSFWEISSNIPELENDFKFEYGEYINPFPNNELA